MEQMRVNRSVALTHFVQELMPFVKVYLRFLCPVHELLKLRRSNL